MTYSHLLFLYHFENVETSTYSVIKLTCVFSSTMTGMQMNNISYTTVIENRATRFGAFFTLFVRYLNGRQMAKKVLLKYNI